MKDHGRFKLGTLDSLLAESRARWLAENPEGWITIKMDEEMKAEIKKRMRWYRKGA